MSIIQTKHLTKTYGKGDLVVEALKDASISVEKGEFVCIIGTSGSGKSTLMHLLAGVDQATSGKIIVNGKEITSLDAMDLALYRRRDVGIIYQFFNLVPVLTAKENIKLPLLLDDKEVDEAFFNEIVSTLNIQDRIDFYPNKLSGGEQQRVAIARALIHRPSIILADEPTGNLNSKLAQEIMQYLALASKKFNQTIVMITHDLNLTHYADRVIEIQDGCIISEHQKQKDTHHKDSNGFEGLNNKSGNYVFDYQKWLMTLSRLYEIDVTSSQPKLFKEIAIYFKWLKESLEAMKHGKLLIMLDVKEKKAVLAFRNSQELFAYIDSLEKQHLITQTRKQQLLHYLQDIN